MISRSHDVIHGALQDWSSLLKRDNRVYYLVTVVSMLLFIPPDGFTFTGPSGVESLVKLLLVFQYFVMLILYLFELKHGDVQRIDGVALLIAAISVMLTISTLINHGSLLILGQKIIYISGPWLYFALFSRFGTKRLVKALNYSFAIVCVLNALTFVAFYPASFRPEEGDFWLFGQRTYMRNLLLPALFLSAINDRLDGKRISVPTAALMITSPIILALAEAATSLITSLILDICIALNLFYKTAKPTIIKQFTIASVVADIAVVHARIIDVFSFVIVDILRKDVTLGKRTEIWDLVQKSIIESPVIGTGIQSLENSGIVLESSKQLSNAHNGLMDVCYKGGIFCLSAFIALIALSVKPLLSRDGNTSVRFLLGSTIGCFFIEAIVSDIWYPQFFLLLYLSAYIGLWEKDMPCEGEAR